MLRLIDSILQSVPIKCVAHRLPSALCESLSPIMQPLPILTTSVSRHDHPADDEPDVDFVLTVLSGVTGTALLLDLLSLLGVAITAV